MDPGTHVALTMAVTHGTLALLALRELWLLRRARRGGGGGPGREPPKSPVPTPPDRGAPPAPRWDKPLPDCLIPKRARVLEDA